MIGDILKFIYLFERGSGSESFLFIMIIWEFIRNYRS